jgi:hypothetical protein
VMPQRAPHEPFPAVVVEIGKGGVYGGDLTRATVIHKLRAVDRSGCTP